MIHTLISSTPSLCGHEWTLLQINGCDCGFQSPRRWLPPHLEQRNALETHRPCCACSSDLSIVLPDQTSVEQLRREIQIFGIMASESPAWYWFSTEQGGCSRAGKRAGEKVSNNKFPQFDKWSTPIIHVPKQAGSSDCMFFLWKYMEFWDGGRPNIDINPAWWKK
ncbi:hypothetical protein GQ55_2G191500 [Panicum hallii var. hallii]|uniref:Ubiquitin-like protease family profile domain-containing protein n=1 Tax=Panicum hallii var. hallii TaxID=1504633 RepID=A0A2T7EPQ9_9POAL|nr:hypothetical protein GQ55_2G145100 [Panicum hallii var. hallii]PUZ70043.1 hypothetical protein GQ55_2G191500 [Panicum hallii var. hallii]